MEIVCPCIQSCIQPCISCIGPPVIRQFGYLKAKENVDDLIRRAGDLEAKKKDIQDQIDAASRHGRQSTQEVTRWIKKVEGLAGEVTIVQTDYNQRGRCWPNCCSRYKIGKRASKLLIKLEAIDTEHARLGVLATDAPPAPVQQMSSTSYVVGNMIISNKEKICEYLKEGTDGVIGIWGMGGVGKTTLLELVNDNFLNNNGNPVTNKLFDHVIFIVVSKEHQLENLQKRIVEKLGLPSREGLDSQAQIISNYLREKNFLLLLDDIWKVVQLKYLGIPDPHSNNNDDGRRFRRKVVFTTRSLQVCADMKCHERNIIKVDCLEPEEAWNLFRENVGEGTINLSGIMRRAKEVTKECGGLPLALVVIGRAMATKKSSQEWDYALTQLKKSQPIPGMETQEYYFSRLKFSYDSLRDDKMRKCLLCCSLWPEDFEIIKEDLVMCWIGLGLIDGFENINDAYDEGYSLIGILIVASLLKPVQDKDDRIKVHDAIRDLALWIAHDNGMNINKWLVKAGVGLEKVPSEMIDKWRVAEVVSLMENTIKELSPHLPMCPNLSTLLLKRNQLTRIPRGFFTCMPNLTYLDLSSSGLIELPKEICCLVQLKYLNLSFTNISTLPEELGQLINLKYLLLKTSKISGGVIRERIMGRLLKLEYLDLFPFGSVDTDELLRLPPLLKGLGMKITSEDALQQISRVVPPILHLCIQDMGDSTTSIHLHRLLSNGTQLSLRELYFCGCRSLRELDVDVGLPRLETLLLLDLEILTEIAWRRSVLHPSECFERLRHLRIWSCPGLKDVTWVLHLPCLEVLELQGCKEMEQLVVVGGGGEEEREEKVTKPTTFPRLTKLDLNKLPKLATICDNHAAVNFPSLEELQVRKCNGLKDITWVLHLPCLERLRLDDCDEMEQLVVIGGGEEVTKPTFPRLTWLTLFRLPKLVMICDNHAAAVNFPSLEIFHVLGCTELKRLPFHPQLLNNCSRLKIIIGAREWWEGIEWEDQSTQSSLWPYFYLGSLLDALTTMEQDSGRRRESSSRPPPPTTADRRGVSEDDFIYTDDGLSLPYIRSSVGGATLSPGVPSLSIPGLTAATTTPETTPVVPIGTNPYSGLLLDHGVYVRRPGFADPPTLPERPANIRRPELWADGATFFPVQAERELGELMRRQFHGPYLNFDDIPPDRRFLWLEMLAKMYWWPEHRDESILKCYKSIVSKRLRDMINDQKTLSLLPGDQRKE